jgi:hypothetical protein
VVEVAMNGLLVFVLIFAVIALVVACVFIFFLRGGDPP